MSRIVRLQAENIMRLVAIDITPSGDLITIGGRNEQGKSSVLNSIAMALGGAAMCPTEPIRAGETEAHVRLDLGDLVVTRRFGRDYLPCNCSANSKSGAAILTDVTTGKQVELAPVSMQDLSSTPLPHDKGCDSFKFGETKSSLTVSSKEGAHYPSPQAILNQLLGTLTFDPLAFTKDANQDTTLRKLVKLDVTPFEKARAEAAAKRALLKKSYDIKNAQLLGLPEHKDAPKTEISLGDISKEMLKAEEYRKLAEEAERAVTKATEHKERASNVVISLHKEIMSLRLQLEALEGQTTDAEMKLADSVQEVEARSITAESARAVVPDVSVIQKRLETVEATNKKVQANQKRATAAAEVDTLKKQVGEQDKLVKKADADKEAALRNVSFPVEGLGLDDKGVTFRGLPFSQASSAEQLRVSVAIGLALNPTLKVLLIRNGNLLDSAHMAMLSKQAEDAGAQLWMEYVTDDAGDVSVMIEEGRVKA